MNAITNPNNKGVSPAGAPSKARVSAKTREAIHHLVTKGCTHEEAATLVGMHRSALTRALSKPHTKIALEEARSTFIKEVMSRKRLYQALAWRRAHNIAQNSTDERTALKAVELLTGEGKQNAPAVSVTVNTGNGYEFVRPGQKLVEIEGAPDRASGDQAAKHIEDAEELPDVEE